MANIRKSFNFRSGLQVDNDNFIVNANGLVGIGTSVPTQYLLNVYGDARITGLTTANSIFLSDSLEVTGVTTVGFITSNNLIVSNDANIGGILTVSQFKVGNSELVDNLIGYARTTFITDNGGIGINTISKVGIGTVVSPGVSDPQLLVLGDVDITGDLTIGSGVTLTNTGNASYSGVVTATTFDGDIDATRLTTGAIPDARFPAALPAISGAALTSLNASNISSGTIDAARVATLNQDTTGTAGGLTGTPNVNLGITTTGNLTAGSIVGTGLSVTSIGIGTAIPANTFQQRATGATELQVTSDTASASVTVGREPGTGNTNNAEFRYGGSAGFPYSTSQSLDLINYGTGNFNYYLSANNAGAAAGDYIWHKGSNSDQLMSLTRDGNLGIGITNPTQLLNVQGTSKFTGDAQFDSNVTIDGNLTVNLGGSFSVSGVVSATSFKGDLLSPNGLSTVIDTGTGNGSDGLSFVNTNVTDGISTFNHLQQTNNSYAAFATDDPEGYNAIDGNALRFVVNPQILPSGTGSPRVVITQKGCIGSGTTNPQCALDLGSATANDDGVSYSSDRFMILPKVSTTNRGNLNNLTAGAVIYNTSLNKIQVYTGSGWETVTSS